MCVVNDFVYPKSVYYFLLLCFVSCSEPVEQLDSSKIVHVQTALVKAETVQEDFNSFGTVLYKTKNDVTPLVEGTLVELYIKPGDTVHKGQVLAQLRNIQLEIQKEQVENALISAKSDLALAQSKMREDRLVVERRLLAIEQSALNLEQQELEFAQMSERLEKNEQLYHVGGLSQSAYSEMQLAAQAKYVDLSILKKEIDISLLGLRNEDLVLNGYAVPQNPVLRKELLIELNTRSTAAQITSAQAGIVSAQKNLDSVKNLIKELTIIAPVDGVISSVAFENGEYIPQNETLATILDISRVYALFFIQERDIAHFTIGTPIKIEIPALNKNEGSRISEISPIADPQSGNFTVKAEIQNSNMLVRPGMFVKCSIPQKTPIPYAYVDEDSLVQKSDSEFAVFCVVNDLAVLKPIDVYRKKDGRVWILSGLKEGDVYIQNPSPFLKEGQYVSF